MLNSQVSYLSGFVFCSSLCCAAARRPLLRRGPWPARCTYTAEAHRLRVHCRQITLCFLSPRACKCGEGQGDRHVSEGAPCEFHKPPSEVCSEELHPMAVCCFAALQQQKQPQPVSPLVQLYFFLLPLSLYPELAAVFLSRSPLAALSVFPLVFFFCPFCLFLS